MLQVCQKYVDVGGRFNGHRSNSSVEADRSQQGQSAPTARCAVRRTFPGWAAPLAPDHFRSCAAFNQEDDVFRRFPADPGPELSPQILDPFAVLFRGMESFF